jgi:hypothetical protein
MKTRLTERDITRIVKRVINEQGEEPMPTPSPTPSPEESSNLNRELKKELMGQLKYTMQQLESDNDVDLCDCLTRLHFVLTSVYENPGLRNKGWYPERCKNFSQLDMLMKND